MPRRFRLGIVTNYADAVVTMVLALATTPLLVRGLGKDAYGTWTLVTSSILYFNLLQFGLGRATVRFVAQAAAVGDLDRVRRIVSTAVAGLAAPGLALVLASPFVGLVFPHLFAVPDGLRTAAIAATVLSTIDLAVAIPADTFGAVLVGFQRYDLLNGTVVVTATAQAVAWVTVLALGGGLVPLAAATVGLSLISQVVRAALVGRLVGWPPVRRRLVDRTLVRPIVSISGWIALTELAGTVIARVDVVVVGAVVGVPQAAVYAVGQKLAALTPRFVDPVATLFYPHAAEIAALDDREAVRSTIVTGMRLSAAVGLPLTLILAVLARPAIHAWVGAGFGDATLVVVFLSASSLAYAVDRIAMYVLRGLGDVKVPALLAVAEAVANLGLSIGLGLTMGLVGVALATLIAHVATNFAVTLPYACRRTGTPLGPLAARLIGAYTVPAAAAVAVGLALRGAGDAGDLIGLFETGLAMLGAYAAAAVVFALDGRERHILLARLAATARLPRRRQSDPSTVLLVDPSTRGGIPRYTELLRRSLGRAGVAAVTLGSVALEEIEAPGIVRGLPDDGFGRARTRPAPARAVLRWLRSAVVVAREVRRRRPAVVHFQAPLNARFDALLVRALRRRTAVVWTAHNVLPHEPAPADRRRFRAVYRAADAVVVHTPPAADELRELADVEPCVIAHPVADEIEPLPRAEARQRLGLPPGERVLAAVGFLRPYKGYELLADVWERLGAEAPRLLVVGEPRPGMDVVVARLARLPRVDLRLGYVEHEELELVVAAADAVLLPYRSGSDSGVLHLARALGVPVLASDAAQLAASVQDARAGSVLPRRPDIWATAVTGELPPPAPPAPDAAGTAHAALYRRVSPTAERRLRLAVYTDALELGGAEEVLRTLVAALPDDLDITVVGVSATVVAHVAGGRPAAARLVLPPVRDKRDLRAVISHLRALRRLRADVLHVNLRHPWSCQYALLSGFFARGTRVVAVEHGATPPAHPRQRVVKRLLAHGLAAHVAVGVDAARRVERLAGLREASIVTIANGVDASGAAAVRAVGSPPTVGMIARLAPVKRVDLFLRAIAELPHVRAVVVGDGDQREALERLVDDLGVRDRVALTGWRADARALVAGFDALVVCSDYETFGLAAVEAMAAGVPVVATAVGGLTEVVRDGETGRLVPPNDVAALVEALRDVLEPERNRILAARARSVARERWPIARMASEYTAVYRAARG